MPSGGPRIAAATAALALLFVVGGLAAAGTAAADDTTGGSGLVVVVGPTDQTSSGEDLGNTGSGSDGSSGSNFGDPIATPGPGETPSAKPGDADLGGVLYLSGLTSNYLWSVDPSRSAVTLHLTVRNVSKSTFDSSARFWIDTPVGNTVSEVKGVRIDRLRPRETRIITVQLAGLGQWTVLHGHATVTPPKSVDGITMAPITRDSYIFVPPLLVGGLGLLGVGAFFLGKFLWVIRLAALAKGIV